MEGVLVHSPRIHCICMRMNHSQMKWRPIWTLRRVREKRFVFGQGNTLKGIGFIPSQSHIAILLRKAFWLVEWIAFKQGNLLLYIQPNIAKSPIITASRDHIEGNCLNITTQCLAIEARTVLVSGGDFTKNISNISVTLKNWPAIKLYQC